MRHLKDRKEPAERWSSRCVDAKARKRFEHALDYIPDVVYSTLVFEIKTHNPRTGTRHHLEIKHETFNGNNRYNVYLNGERWRNSWSRTGFTKWLFKQIESVRVDWEN